MSELGVFEDMEKVRALNRAAAVIGCAPEDLPARLIEMQDAIALIKAKLRAHKDGRARLVADISVQEINGIKFVSGVVAGYEFDLIDTDWE